uniref:Chitin-binding type-2 domain-containing protein n=1 Tax=Anopheles maculatus TaxID=74869 RepID=A0A182SYZ2_9DIPT
MVSLDGQWKSSACSFLVFMVVLIVGSYETSSPIVKCPPPRCVTYEEINTYWVDPSPAFFQQCRPMPNGTWAPQKMPCGPVTLFSFRQQTCVPEANWNATDSCTEIGPPDPICRDPSCKSFEEINTLWAHSSPKMFYQCRPAPNLTWVPEAMPCGPGTLFSFKRQGCELESMWNGTCTDP